MVIALIVVGVVVALALIVLIWGISVKNAFVRLNNNADEAYSNMDIYMKKRYDLIPNYVETVKGYAKHEKETLERVIQARNACLNATNAQEKSQNENILSNSLKSLFALSESYPELKANSNFIGLQQQLSSLEEEILNARKYYNGCVKVINTKIDTFPSSIIAKMTKQQKRVLFEISQEERANPKVQF